MKTKKEKTIIACGKQAEKYRNPELGDKFFDVSHCYMCDVHPGCAGCPLAEEKRDKNDIRYLFCKQFKTYENAQGALEAINPGHGLRRYMIYPDTLTKRVLSAFKARAKFYDWLVIELKKYPASQFTKKGWKDFELNENL